MSKDLLHTDSIDDLILPPRLTPVPLPELASAPCYSGLGWLYALEAKLAFLMRVAMFAATLSLGLLMAAQVFMRYAISSPFLGIEELAPMLALWIYFLGMSYCSRERDHIEGSILTLVVKDPQKLLAIRLFGSIVVVAAVIVFAWFAWKYAAFNLSLGRKSTYMRLPKYIWDLAMVSGFALMSLYGALQVLVEARSLLSMKRGRA
ncbi:MAG: TRAP transporter small permease [Notoacmeibacter sp.]|nr:TRAP transporter small permease [Notoacmeibacter sp.]